MLGALGAVILEPGAAAADDAASSGEEAVPAEVFDGDDEEIDYSFALFGSDDTE